MKINFYCLHKNYNLSIKIQKFILIIFLAIFLNLFILNKLYAIILIEKFNNHKFNLQIIYIFHVVLLFKIFKSIHKQTTFFIFEIIQFIKKNITIYSNKTNFNKQNKF